MSEPYDKAVAKLLGSASGGESTHLVAPSIDGIEPVLAEMIFSFLLWETTPKQAAGAMPKLMASFIDLNELRISLNDELCAAIGARYARCEERVLRLRMALNKIFLLEHEMSLARLAELSKRDARQYLADLPGVPPFVASRVALLTLDVHAFPVDDRLRQLLVSRDAIDPASDNDQASGWLERQFRAGDARDAYLALERLAEKSRSKQARKTAGKASSRKSSSSKASKKASGSRSTGKKKARR